MAGWGGGQGEGGVWWEERCGGRGKEEGGAKGR